MTHYTDISSVTYIYVKIGLVLIYFINKGRIDAFDAEIQASDSLKLREISGARTSAHLVAAQRIINAPALGSRILLYSQIDTPASGSRILPILNASALGPNSAPQAQDGQPRNHTKSVVQRTTQWVSFSKLYFNFRFRVL
jgi:hypothetical protein